MCTLETMVPITFYVLTKGYTDPENQGTHYKLKRTVSPWWILSVRYVLLTFFHRNVEFLIILLYTTYQHQKYDIFHVEHFS